MRQRLAEWMLSLSIFLLPMQARWIFAELTIGNEPSSFGVLTIHAVEVFIVLTAIVRGRSEIVPGAEKAVQAMYVVFAAGFLSLTFANEYSLGLLHLLHVLVAGALFVLLCDRRTNIQQVLLCFSGGLILASGLGWYQVITGTSPASTFLGLAAQDAQIPGTTVVETQEGRLLRAYGTFPHPNIFGGYLAVGIIGLAWLVRFFHHPVARWLWVPTIILTSTLMITFSRSAWLGLFLSCLLLIALMLHRKRTFPERAKPLIALGLFTIVATAVIFSNQFFARFNPALRVEAISVEERSTQYTQVDDIFFTHPLIGVGPAGYVFALASIFPGKSVWAYQPIHNTPLLVLSELGLIGFAALFYFLARIDQVNAHVSKTASGMLGFTLGVCLIVISLFDHYLWSLWPGLALSAFSFALIVRWSNPKPKLVF